MTAAPLAVTAQRPAPSAAGERLAAALTSLEQLDPPSRVLAQDALAAVVDVFGEGVERLVALTAAGPVTAQRLADDEIWTALLVLYDVHPVPVEHRVEQALATVRPYLGSHSGDVELAEVDGSVARIKLLGGCDGCGASEQTLRGLIETAVQTAAPEIVTVEVVPGEPAPVLLQITSRPQYTSCPVESIE